MNRLLTIIAIIAAGAASPVPATAAHGGAGGAVAGGHFSGGGHMSGGGFMGRVESGRGGVRVEGHRDFERRGIRSGFFGDWGGYSSSSGWGMDYSTGDSVGTSVAPAVGDSGGPVAGDSGADAADFAAEDIVVREVQKALTRAGYYHYAVDGFWGLTTQNAVEAYERANRLPVTGAIDAPLMHSLGLQ